MAAWTVSYDFLINDSLTDSLINICSNRKVSNVPVVPGKLVFMYRMIKRMRRGSESVGCLSFTYRTPQATLSPSFPLIYFHLGWSTETTRGEVGAWVEG